MAFTLLIEEEPVSVNNSNRREEFESSLKRMMQAKYPLKKGAKCHYTLRDRLYVQLFYIHKGRKTRDIDNIIKYIVDSFRKYLYPDDRQIEYILSQSIECQGGGISQIDTSEMDDDIASGLTQFLLADSSKNDISITYFECGLLNDKFFNLNLESKWK